MDDIALPSVTIPRAARAVGYTTRQLRAILAPHTRFPLLGQPGRTARQRNRIAPIDIVRLAFVKRLGEYGFTVWSAQCVLDQSIDNLLLGLATCGVGLPGSFIISQLAAIRVCVANTPNRGLVVEMQRPHAVERCISHDATFLTLDAEAIARAALQRLAQGT